MTLRGIVEAVSRSSLHRFHKQPQTAIRLLAGLGVEGDAHAGETVQHLSRVRVSPGDPNLRQVHLLPAELFEELAGRGFTVRPGDIGDNVTTRGLDLLALPRGTRLRLGAEAVVEVTGLRTPCRQVEAFQTGLMHALIDRDRNGEPILRAGIMGIVSAGGEIRVGDAVLAELPPPPHVGLRAV